MTGTAELIIEGMKNLLTEKVHQPALGSAHDHPRNQHLQFASLEVLFVNVTG